MASNVQEVVGEPRREEPAHDEKAAPQNFDIVPPQSEAANATRQEHTLTVWQAIKKYPKACLWSLVVSMVIIMEGYDTILIGSLYGFPAFQHRFGYDIGNGNWQVEAKWQTALSMCGSVAGIFGIFVNSMLTERVGHRKAIIGNLVFLIGCIFIVFFATDIRMLFAGEFLCSIPWGVFTVVAPVYASEVGPVQLRAYFETYVVLCWGIGQFFAWAVLDSLEGSLSNWSWRIPFAVQWVWPVIIIPLVYFAPESPWWLVRKGRIEEAEKELRRLSSFDNEQELRDMISLMVETTALERQMTEGATYIDCFRGSNLWRTEISCCSYISQVLTGFALTAFANYFFEQAGLTAAESYKLTLGQGGLNLVCTMLSCLFTYNFGRRTIFIVGTAFMCTVMFTIGCISLAPQTPTTAAASAAMYMLWFCIYLLALGPVTYIIIGETSSTRLRNHTIALARNAYNLFCMLSNGTAPVILNPGNDNWKGKSGFLAAGLGLLCCIWGIFRLPESKGRTYEELDILYSQNLKPWQFKDFVINREEFIDEKTTRVGHAEHIEG